MSENGHDMDFHKEDISAETIVSQRIPAKKSVKHKRPPTSELELFWTIIAAGLLVAIVLLFYCSTMKWRKEDQQLMDKYVLSVQTNESIRSPLIADYKELAKERFGQTCEINERFIMGNLVPIFTVIAGYVFGVSKRHKNEDDT